MLSTNLFDLEIEKLTKTLVSKNKKVVALHGVEENEAYKLMNNLINLMDVQIPEWSSVSNATVEQCIDDIRNFLLSNATMENFKNLPTNSTILNWWKKRRISKIINKLEELDTARSGKVVTSRSGIFLLPILTTLSTLGATLAVPLLSIAFLRTKEIVELWGNGGFHALVGSCFSLVFIIIIATFVTLFNNIKNNHKDYIVKNMNNTLLKIFDKYFILDSKFNIKNKITFYTKFIERSKLVISNHYTFFYDTINVNGDNYVSILKYFKTLNHFNNTVVFNASEYKYLDERKIFRNVFSEDKIMVARINRYKNKTSGRRLMNFIFYQISMISSLNTKKLLQKYPLFVNALYRFLEYSESNSELLNLLLDVKRHAYKISSQIDESYQRFFVDFFVLAVFRALDENGFDALSNDISYYGKPSEETSNNVTYTSLKLDQILNNNVINFGQQAFIFNLPDYFEETDNKNIFAELSSANKNIDYSPRSQIAIATKQMKEKGYTPQETSLSEDLWYDACFSSDHDDDTYLKVFTMNENTEYFKELHETFEQATKSGVKNLLIYVYSIKMLYRLIDDQYELVNETIS
ncbi:hypothetical protein [Ureaplasma diversum]|uniref:Uncharacterized protein n=1 Tax=Ureaplasma diversum NCTC 246 TaxID=1188241 RepID=A0A084EWN1_9BACT|nr:hypothetical protein [Ureaplasma diversum]KEZ22373.1 Hypothetical protein, predicted transmembrane protein [Ureaplasma diversum NCTC 246]